MSEITAKDVAALRKKTGAGMMDAKRALEESGGDLEAAERLLMERGLASARKRADRAADQGTIGSYLHFQADRPVIGVLVELVCETDFVAKSTEFKEAANDIAMHVAWARPRWLSRDEVPESAIDDERALITAQARNEGKPEEVITKIVDGKVGSFYADTVLLDQTFANAEKFAGTVGAMVEALGVQMKENISVRRFSRLGVGEGSGE
jgi:elongation factor Ts